MPKKITDTQRLQTLLDTFDFERCAKAMAALKWTWHGSPESPTVADLKNSVREKFASLLSQPRHVSVYSGGLRLSREMHDGQDWWCLEFILADAEVERAPSVSSGQ